MKAMPPGPAAATPRPAGARAAALRRWHRWIMTVAGLLLLYMAVSGLGVATVDVLDDTQLWAREGGGPGARLVDPASLGAPLPDPATLAAGIAAAMQASVDMPVASVDLRRAGGRVRLQLAQADGDRATMRRFDAATGVRLSNDETDDAPPPRTRPLRNVLKSWHYGLALGLPGQFVGLLAGLCLAALAVSGIWLYTRLWKMRRDAGRGALLWGGGESRWRRLHRAVALLSAAFVLNIAITGSILAAGELQLMLAIEHHLGTPPYPRPTPMPPVSRGTLPLDVTGMLQRAHDAAQARRPDAGIAVIQLVVSRGIAKALVTVSHGTRLEILAFDALDGHPVDDPATSGVQSGQGYFADWHQVVKRMHRGDIFGGFAGRGVDIAAGLAMLYLVVSGLVMYAQARARRGGSDWFWR